jgi:hypothetical protein
MSLISLCGIGIFEKTYEERLKLVMREHDKWSSHQLLGDPPIDESLLIHDHSELYTPAAIDDIKVLNGYLLIEPGPAYLLELPSQLVSLNLLVFLHKLNAFAEVMNRIIVK